MTRYRKDRGKARGVQEPFFMIDKEQAVLMRREQRLISADKKRERADLLKEKVRLDLSRSIDTSARRLGRELTILVREMRPSGNKTLR